jgi:hypothetical protein
MKIQKDFCRKETQERKDKSLCCFSLRSLRSFAAIQLWLRLAAAGMRLRQGYGAQGGLPALPFPPPSLTPHKRFFHSLDKHSSDFRPVLSILHPQSSIRDPQSAIRNPQSAIRHMATD